MTIDRVNLQGLVDSVSGNLLALIAPDIVGGRQYALGGGAVTVAKPLSADYVLTALDDNTVYYATVGIVVHVPAGLNPKPNVGFLCPGTGSITVRMDAGATHDGGLTTDVVQTLANCPAGFSISPATLPTDLTSNDYSVTRGLLTFSQLGGAATDNASLVALFPQLANMAEYSQGGAGRVRSSLGGALTLDPAQCIHGGATPPGCTLRNISNGNRTVTLPTGMPQNYWFELRHDTAAAGITTSVAKSAGVSWNQRVVGGSNALKLASQGFYGILRMYDTDAWEFLGSDWTV